MEILGICSRYCCGLYAGKVLVIVQISYATRALKIFDRIDAKHEKAITLFNIAMRYKNAGELDEALKYYEKARELFLIIGDTSLAKVASNEIRDIHAENEKNKYS